MDFCRMNYFAPIAPIAISAPQLPVAQITKAMRMGIGAVCSSMNTEPMTDTFTKATTITLAAITDFANGASMVNIHVRNVSSIRTSHAIVDLENANRVNVFISRPFQNK